MKTPPARSPAVSGASPAANPLAAYPQQLHHSTLRRDLVYTRAGDCFALPLAQAQESRATVLASLQAEDGQVLQLCSGQPEAGTELARAAYRTDPGGSPQVPSGKVFVRFAEGVRAQDRAKALAATGCRVESVPAYAPQAAWLAPAGDNPAQALSAIEKLEALPDMVNVEPQWLMARALKA